MQRSVVDAWVVCVYGSVSPYEAMLCDAGTCVANTDACTSPWLASLSRVMAS